MGARIGGWFGAMLVACSSGPITLGSFDTDQHDAAEAQDASSNDAGRCLPPSPVHHWRFDGQGDRALDEVGGAPAELHGGVRLDGSGLARLDGVDDYIALPAGLLAGRDAVTILLWLRHRGGPAYTRLLDIGTTSLGRDPALDASYVGRSYLVLTPSTGFVADGLAAMASIDGAPGEVAASSDLALDTELHMVGLRLGEDLLSLLFDGAVVTRVPEVMRPSQVLDHNAWLGRSQYAQDPYLAADYRSVLVFDRALDECEIQAWFEQPR